MAIRTEYNMETGETTEVEYEPEPYVPEIVYRDLTPRQLRLALLNINVHEADVDAALANDPAGSIEWKYASAYKRTHPLIDGLSSIFSLTSEQVDSLWLWAQEL